MITIAALAVIGHFAPAPNTPTENSDARQQVQGDRAYFRLGSDKGLRDPLPTPPAKPKPVAPAAPIAKPVAAAPGVSVGDRTYLTAAAVACPNSDATDRAYELAGQRDQTAVLAFLVGSGCTILERGQQVFYERPSLFGNTGIRVPGSPTILWVNPNAVHR